MISVFILSPYILVPFILAILFRQYKPSVKSLSYLLTAFLIFLYPIGLFWLQDFLSPPPLVPRCGNPQMGFVLGNIFIFLPIALLLQFVFNKLFIPAKNKST